MPAPQLPDHVLRDVAEAYKRLGMHGYTLLPGVGRSSFESRVTTAIARGFISREDRRTVPPDTPMPACSQYPSLRGGEVEIAPAPSADEPIAELLARKKAHMQRAQAHEEWANLIPVSVKTEGPIGLFLVGDPHLDDDHCDIERLESDLTTVGKTKGFYAGHVGDITNNWVGRLKALYAAQSTRFDDAQRLTEWMFNLCPNLFVVGGNHDCWEKGMDILRFIVRQGPSGPLQAHGVRMALRWPGGQEIRIHARHDFPGKSQFSDTHGMKRELLFGHRDHILVAGHTHVDEARIEPSLEGEAHWMFRVSGYKVIDDFAKEKGFRPKRLAPGVALVIDPRQPVPAERIKPFWCVEAAADYLTFLRQKAAA